MDALHRITRTHLVRAGALAAVLAAAAACSSSTTKAGGYGAPAATTKAGSSGTAAAIRVVVGTTAGHGSYLTDGAGRALYEFASDSPGKSTCSGSCLTYWPALASGTVPGAGSGVAAAKLVVFTRPDGTKQVSYAGHPLYYFAQDHAPGDTNGEGSTAFGASWWLLSPAGTPITTGSGAPASSGSSGSGSGGGYIGGGYGHG